MIPNGLALKAATAWRLGPSNIARVLLYRAQLKARMGAAGLRPNAIASGEFFHEPVLDQRYPEPPPLMPLKHFGWLASPMTPAGRPDWFLNPHNGQRFTRLNEPWYNLADFDPAIGDIKYIWELSRFDWVVRHAQHLAHKPDARILSQLNDWLRDWVTSNPAYTGPNWKCGQETSLRVLHLAFAARLLAQTKTPTSALTSMLSQHLARIAPTTGYAVAQDSNHGTSEGAALFVGGSWLQAASFSHQSKSPDTESQASAARWALQGRHLLEDRVARLFMPDGSFSQYSVNYHRMVVDTLSFVEIWRRQLELEPFSPTFMQRAAAATRWLHTMTAPETGTAPMLGSNDGARIFPVLDGYTDHRPSVALASALFLDARPYPPGPWDSQLIWHGAKQPAVSLPKPDAQLLDDGGYAILRNDTVTLYVRYPRYRFRPSHADALHVDVWHHGHVVLGDAGTYSYNTDAETYAYFTGTAAHNTVEFDSRDQMPKISRFLFGKWLEARDVTFAGAGHSVQKFAAGYRDWQGASHHRTVALDGARITVTDKVAGFKSHAVLRWRLQPGTYNLDGMKLLGPQISITLSAPGDIRITLTEGSESVFYGRRSPVPVLEIRMSEPQSITTTIDLAS